MSYRLHPIITMKLHKATNEKIFIIIKNLNYKKSPDFDGIQTTDMKHITPVIQHLIHACINTHTYPQHLKIDTTYIYKNKSQTNINDYRPITILTTNTNV